MTVRHFDIFRRTTEAFGDLFGDRGFLLIDYIEIDRLAHYQIC